MNAAKLILALLLTSMIMQCDEVDSKEDSLGSLEIQYNFAAVSDWDTVGAPATGRVYVCLYNQFGLYPEHYLIRSEASEANPSSSESIIIDRVYTGQYTLMVFYDQNYDADTLPSAGDPYCIYDSDIDTTYTTYDPYEATPITVYKNVILHVDITYDGTTEFNSHGGWGF